MEEQLDEVERGEIPWKKIREFYPNFSETLKTAEEEIGNIDISN